MSLDTRGIDPRRLLPQSLEDRLLGWLGRFGGALLLASTLLVWASLASWSVLDPSLTHTTTVQARNFVGPVGAIISDLLFQTLGFAAVVALIAPFVWSIELLRTEHVVSGRSKLGFYPISILTVAGSISALPVFEGWPLRHGYGGLLGDSLLHLATKVFSVLNDERAPVAAGLVLAAAAVQMSGKAIGFEAEAMVRAAFKSFGAAFRHAMTEPRGEIIRSAPVLAATTATGLWARLRGSKADDQHAYTSLEAFGTLQPAEPSLVHAADDFGRSQCEPHDGGARQFAAHTLAMPMAMSDPERLGAALAAPRGVEEAPVDDAVDPIYAFDDNIENSSRAIAARFAPASSKVRVAPHSPSPQPTGAATPPPSEAASAPKLTGGLLGGLRNRVAPQWKRPSLNVFKRPSAAKPSPELSQTVMRGNARLLEDVLADFGVKGEVKDIRPGPVVTLYEFEPSRGTKSSRVIGLAEDIARSMSLASVRAAVVPGRNAIGLELPNARRETVLLREILEADSFKSDSLTLPIGLGKSIGGEPVVADLARMPHLLVAGTTGSGKSVGINAMVLSLLYRHSPDDCRLLMIDPKMLELSVYNGIPHLLTPVITDPHKAVAALNWAVREMEERYKQMAALSVRNIDVFNNRVRNAKKRGEILSRRVQTGFDKSGQARFETQKMDLEPLPRIVLIVDEFADLMIVAGKEVEASVQRLAQMARAAGIHLIMATQRPSVDIITGTIKANFPTRVSFKVTSKIDSRTILNEQGAEQLLGQGDMLYSTGAGQCVRVHGAYVSDEEVVAFADVLRQEGAPKYIEGITDVPPPSEPAHGGSGTGEEDLYDRAVAIVMRDGKASTSYIQRRLSIGYNRAADLIERMEREGLISAANGVGKREILMPRGSGADAAA
ncbi:cell division protein FtsK/SpoIIIE [Hyphomicrobium denitrificans 1NES1]|uniref:DNA translocase FtsK n=1 Tax=Hyphomicrobium denitrificans 1NES1 TaxID=670307 RepID=N0BHL0_9HYPH|nr:DNA translocase FtsK 4TM domain-containing protein [Hyphomicrobium denitrificans]AGK59640.1 cell division protein FtsK/SpoIIIE [Hyphomicrobium denitrificans 1NES1]